MLKFAVYCIKKIIELFNIIDLVKIDYIIIFFMWQTGYIKNSCC